MTDQEFEDYISLGHESADLEFKGPGSITDRQLLAQVVKAALGMANHRDGGNIIVGVAENSSSFERVGLTDDQASSWTFDGFSEQIARYADPGVSFELEEKQYQGNRFIVLEVRQFEDVPVLCKRAFDDVLRPGACYVRTIRKPETSEIPTQTEMRELLELATDKQVRKYLERAQRLGLISAPTVIPTTVQDLFDQELGDSI